MNGGGADATELGPPPLVLLQDGFVAIRSETDIVVDEEHGVAIGASNPDVPLHRQPSGGRMVVIEGQPDAFAQLLDLGAHRRLVTRVDDAKVFRKERLADQGLDRRQQLIGSVPGGDDER